MDIQNRVIKSEEVEWRKLNWLQGMLKEISPEDIERLKTSFRKNGFFAPFHVWENDHGLFILDGHHRKQVMQELEKEGEVIPDLLPAIFVDCKDLQEAKKFILLFSSQYARINKEALHSFLHVESLKFEVVAPEINIPNIDMSGFEIEFIKKPSSFLDDVIEEGEAAVEHSGTGEQEDDAPGPNGREEYIKLVYPCTPEQRDVVMKAINTAKDKWELESSVEALVNICREFSKKQKK
jgi:hypothetical protein